jgi:PAS domain S-box-containing protein
MEKEINYWKEKYDELKIALDLAAIQITITDGNGVFTATNKPCEDFIGIKEEELLGKSCFELESAGVFDLSATAEVLRRKKKVRFVQRTKANKVILVTGHPIFDENSNITKIVNISHDITERKNLEKQLEEAEGTLQWYKHEMATREKMKNNTLVAQSKTMSRNKELLDNFAFKDILILLLGDTGVGKNYTAQYIHKISQRNKEPFVAINCGAIPEQLLESELFGYEKGSFTGALTSGKEGLFQYAGGGTILLDEIAEMPLGLQVKLLSVLDEKKFRRIGGREEIDLKARIIVATNKDLQQCVADGTFREDLYYRINVLPITIPSLTERKEDIPDLADKFLKIYNEKYDSHKRISLSAYEALLMYSYPGNIRELKNIMERLVILSESEEITSHDMQRLIKTVKTVNDISTTDTKFKIVPLKQGVENYEKQLLKAAAEKYKTTREQAKALEVDQSTIVKKRKKYFL